MIAKQPLRAVPLLATLFCVLAFALAPVAAHGQAVRIVFASGPDATGTVRRLVDEFNAEQAGRIQVAWQEMDRDNNTHHRQLTRRLAAGDGAPHVFASDVIWTAEFASNGWVSDLTDRFYGAYDRSELLDAALRSATYRLRIWGVPWYTDAGILFYRKDLLAENGFDTAPRTWDELIAMARQVMKASGVRHGLVFQGAEYEGGTANAAEFLWSAGGDLMARRLKVTSPLLGTVAEVAAITVESAEAVRGFDLARRLIADGIAPAEVTSYREKESLDAFLAGDALFLRSWPYVHGLIASSPLARSQVGVAPLPALSPELTGYSCLGGWNLMVNARAGEAEQAAAWELIRYLTSPAQQKRQALEAGLLPVLESLYDDPELLDRAPVVALARETIASRIRVRPSSPFYTEVSAQVAKAFHRVLEGEISGTRAVELLDRELREIAIRNHGAN